MFNGIFRVPQSVNEPVLSYAPGTREREGLQAKLGEMLAARTEVPMIIDGKEVIKETFFATDRLHLPVYGRMKWYGLGAKGRCGSVVEAKALNWRSSASSIR